MRYGLLVLLGLILLGMASVAVLLPRATPSPVALPTMFVLPSLTPSTTPTHSATPTSTPTATVTSTATATHTPTMTASPTFTPTLSTRVLEIRAVMPGVYVPPTPTAFPFGTILLPAPPQPVEPLPDATNQPPPYDGWYSFESDNPAVQYSAPWSPRWHANASRGQYHRSENVQSYVSFRFEGEGLRIRYVAARNMGMFDVIVDGVVIDTIDAYAPELHFPATQIYFVGKGAHTLTIRSSQQKNSASEGYAVGLDAVQVFRGTANTLIIPPPAESATPTQLPIPAAGIELINAPPTARPTVTVAPPGPLSVSVIIAYDENGNRAVDPSEGVLGIPVRIVAVGTNRVIAQGFTDRSGFVHLTVVNSGAARVVVPYFGKVWQLPANRRGGQAAFTLLLAPANQPGLIP